MNDAATVTLVVNPSAGRGKAGKLLPKVIAEFLDHLPCVSLRVHQARDYREAQEFCAAAVASARPAPTGGRHDCLVVMGGDGMMHLGLNAAAETDVPLGLLPAGTGNDFCRGVGVPGDALKAARIVAAGVTRRIDLTRAEGALTDGATSRYVGSVVSTGYDSRVNRRTNAMRRTFGPTGYAYAAIKELSEFEPLQYVLTIDGRERRQTAMLVAVANAGFFGGGMKIAPDYDLTDGLLDVTIIHPVSKATLLRLLPTMFTGGFVKDPAVERLRASTVRVDGEGLYGMADGEALGLVPLNLAAVPQALTVYVP